ncbi:unnamed protein product [Xylocopa violacea]|uniref:Reverse transcriptase n=1 Tax=Xylocopa violacea TaxID=135666 RepID=A0ABP1MYW0_XYLVO
MTNSSGGPSGSAAPASLNRSEDNVSEASPPVYRCEYPSCDRTFSTTTGRGVHHRRAHADWYDERANVAAVKKRWNDEEIKLLARKEAELTREGVKFLNQELCKAFPSRTLESIKGQRKRADYKQLVVEMLKETPTAPESQSLNNVVTVPSAVCPVEDRSSLRQAILEYILEIRVPNTDNFNCRRLLGIRNAMTNIPVDVIHQRLSLYIHDTFSMPRSSHQEHGSSETSNKMSKRAQRRAEYARTQRLWTRNPNKCLRSILKRVGSTEIPPKEEMVPFWENVMTRESPSSLIARSPEDTKTELWAPITMAEMKKAFPSLGTASGPDGLTARLLRKVPAEILLIILNIFLWCGKVPSHLLESTTILLPKKDQANKPEEFRPITISSVMIRTFHKVLALRTQHLIKNDDRQRGFRNTDGCAENVFLLDTILKFHHKAHKPLFLASIDVAKAFDSVSHSAIMEAMRAVGVPGIMIDYIESLPEEIAANISGIKINAAAFADDIIFTASTEVGLQILLDVASEYLTKCGLNINTHKSMTVTLRPVPHEKKTVVDAKTTFTLYGRKLPSLKRTDAWSYLGVPFTAEGRLNCNPTTRLEEALTSLTKAPLKPQQRLFGLRTMVIPGLYHLLALGSTKISILNRADKMVRAAVRKWLDLPHDTIKAYFHAKISDGGLGLPSYRWKIPLLRYHRLKALVLSHGAGTSTPGALLESEMAAQLRRLDDHGTRLSTTALVDKRWADALHDSFDGRALKDSVKTSHQHQWTGEGNRFLSGRDFINAVKLRINALPTRSRTSRGRRTDRQCRGGCTQPETLNHVLQICHRTSDARVRRHDALVAYVQRSLANQGYDAIKEPHINTSEGLRKPDIIATLGQTAIVLDAQVVGEQVDLDAANANKVRYYESNKDVAEHIKRHSAANNVVFVALTINCRGRQEYAEHGHPGKESDNVDFHDTHPPMVLPAIQDTMACPICLRKQLHFSFISPSELDKHLKLHHLEDEIQWACLKCNKSFPKLHSTRCHYVKCKGVVVVTGSKLFPCEVCPKSFDSQRGLSTHERHEHPVLRNKKRQLASTRNVNIEGTNSNMRGKHKKVWSDDEIKLLTELDLIYANYKYPNIEIGKHIPSKTRKQISDKRKELRLTRSQCEAITASKEVDELVSMDTIMISPSSSSSEESSRNLQVDVNFTSGITNTRDTNTNININNTDISEWHQMLRQTVDNVSNIPKEIEAVYNSLMNIWQPALYNVNENQNENVNSNVNMNVNESVNMNVNELGDKIDLFITNVLTPFLLSESEGRNQDSADLSKQNHAKNKNKNKNKNKSGKIHRAKTGNSRNRVNRNKYKKFTYARCQEMYKKCPKRLADIAINGDNSFLEPSKQPPSASQIMHLYHELWETPGPTVNGGLGLPKLEHIIKLSVLKTAIKMKNSLDPAIALIHNETNEKKLKGIANSLRINWPATLEDIESAKKRLRKDNIRKWSELGSQGQGVKDFSQDCLAARSIQSQNSSETPFQCRMEGCSKAFKTSRGRGVHEQKQHRNWYDERQAASIVNQKARWSSEEASLLARQEARLNSQGERFMNQALMPFFPNRTLESIKGQRRRAEHKGKVLEYIKELEAPPQDLAAVDQHQSTEAEPALVDGIKEALVALEPIEGTDFSAVHLNKICSNIKQWTNDKIFEETMSYLRSIFPPSPKDLRRIRKGASKVLTKRQERRAEYGRTQRAWRRSPFNCLRTILKGKNTANTPSQETMTNYWSTVMTNASAKSPGIEPSTRTLDALWKPIEPEEVKRAFPETTTSPGPDLVLSTRLMHSIDLDKRQKAFVPVDGCAENTFLFDMLLRHHRQTFKPLYLASVDIRKAFDSVTHQAILDALVSRGVPGPMVYRLLRSIPKEIGVDVSGEHHNALAFADDLVLVASTPQGLQQTLDLTTDYLAQCGLAINTGKSFTVAIRNVPHIKKSVVDSKVRFRCAGALLPAMRREDEWKYLGVPFTPEGRVTCNPEQQLQEAIAILSRAALKPQQRLFALRVMVLPSLYHVLTLGSTNLSRLKRVDNLVRGAARKWLALPHDVVNAYFHANAKDGGLSIPSMRWLMPLRRKERLEALAKGGSEPLSFLAQEIEKARRRLKDGRQELDHRDKIEKRWAKLLHSSVDGKALNESRKVLTQNQWVLDGTRFLSGKDFINSVKLRINALPTKSRSNRGRQGDRLCRAGCNAIETLNHIMQICPRTHAARVARHNAIAAYVKRALAKNYKNVVEEPHIRTPSGLRKPDLVAMRDNTVLVIDAQVVGEQSDLARAHEAKKTYYRESIHRELAEKYNTSDIKYTSVTISCRGIWSKQSAEDLIDLKVLKKKDLKVLSSRALIGGLNAYWITIASDENSGPPTGGSHPAPSGEAATPYRCGEPGCDRAFTTIRGLGVHKRRAHATTADMEMPAPTKPRWTEEEIAMLAKEEARLTCQGERFLNQALERTFRPRTLEAIKGQRRRPAYKQMVQELIVEMRAAVEPPEPSPHDDNNEGNPILVYLTSLQVLDNSSYQAAELQEIINCLKTRSTEETIQYLGIYLRKIHPPPQASKKKMRCPETPGQRQQTRRQQRRHEYAMTQIQWRRNRKRCIANILDGLGSMTQPSQQAMEPFWREMMSGATDESPMPEDPPTTHQQIWAPITEEEIRKAMLPRGTAKGPDGLSSRQLRAVPTEILVRIFNIILLCKRLPDNLRTARTIFLPKTKDAKEPGDFRPITIPSVMTRCFHKILAARTSMSVEIDDRQRAFRPTDGCRDNTFLLDLILKYHHNRFKNVYMASLDVQKAFDSISHIALVNVMRTHGCPKQFVEYVSNTYKDGTTILEGNGWTSSSILQEKGVKQGDPLSPIIFNMVMNQLLKKLTPEIGCRVGRECVNAAAFADDLILFAETPRGLQNLIDTATQYLRSCGLTINIGKSLTIGIRANAKLKKTAVDVQTKFNCDGRILRTLGRGEEIKYLGIKFNPQGRSRFKPQDVICPGLENLRRAPLKPQQRLFALRIGLIPRVYYHLALGDVTISALKTVDVQVRQAVRKWLNLPHDVPTAYFHADVKDGGLGIPSLRWTTPLHRMDRLTELKRHHIQLRDEEMDRYLDNEIDKCKRRLRNNSRMLLKLDDLKRWWAERLYESVDGKGLRGSSAIPQQHQWIADGKHVRKRRLPSETETDIERPQKRNEKDSQEEKRTVTEGKHVIDDSEQETETDNIHTGTIYRIKRKAETIQRKIVDHLTNSDNGVNQGTSRYLLNKIGNLQSLLQESLLMNSRLEGKLEALKSENRKQRKDFVAAERNVTTATQPQRMTYAERLGIKSRTADLSNLKQDPPKVVLIRPTDTEKYANSEETKRAVIKLISPKEENLQVKNVRRVQGNAVIVETARSSNVQTLIKNEKLKTAGLLVDVPTKKSPRVIIYGAPRIEDDKEILQAIFEQNFNEQERKKYSQQTKIAFKTGNKNNKNSCNIVVETSKDVRELLIKKERLYIMWQCCKVQDYIVATRCYKCQGHGHTTKYCRSEVDICGHCAMAGHTFKNCPSKNKPATCVNCKKAGKAHNHNVTDKDCPSHIAAINQVLSRTDYGNYFQHSDNIEPYLQQLDIILTALKGKNIVICLDANAKSPIWHSRTSDERGEKLELLIAQRNLFILNAPTDVYTFNSFQGQTNIDVTLISSSYYKSATNWKVHDATTTSDHNLITFQINANILNKTGPQTLARYNLKRANWEKFQQTIEQERIKQPTESSSANPNTRAIDITKMIQSACNTAIPKKKQFTKSVPWWNATLTKLKAQTRKARRTFQQTTLEPRRSQEKKNYTSIRNKYITAIRTAKTDSWKNFVNIEGNANPWSYVYKLNTNKIPVETVPENIKYNNTHALSWEESTTALLNELLPSDDTSEENNWHQAIRTYIQKPPDTENAALFTQEEVQNTIRNLKNKKAPGHDLIDNEIIKIAWTQIGNEITNLMNLCLLKETFPQIWKRGVIRILIKNKNKDKTNPRSYRPICLLPTLSKVLEKLISYRITNLTNQHSETSNRQFGFKKGRSTEDAIVEMRKITEENTHKYAIGLLFDIEGAFDNVWWPSILHNLKKRNCPRNLYLLIKSYLSERSVEVTNANAIVMKEATKGCPQGLPLSPNSTCSCCLQKDMHIGLLNISSLKSHVTQYHKFDNISYICCKCLRQFKGIHNWECHYPKCKGPPNTTLPYCCEHCELSFGSKRGLSTHERSRHPEIRNQKRMLQTKSKKIGGRSAYEWTQDEVRLLTELEQRFHNLHQINKEIHKYLPSKSIKQISDKRRQLRTRKAAQRDSSSSETEEEVYLSANEDEPLEAINISTSARDIEWESFIIDYIKTIEFPEGSKLDRANIELDALLTEINANVNINEKLEKFINQTLNPLLIGVQKPTKNRCNKKNRANKKKRNQTHTRQTSDYRCEFPGCTRSFTTATGRGVHHRRAHQDWYDARTCTNVPAKKTRWNSEEEALLARKEAELVQSGVRFINQALHRAFPERSLESIKSHRKSASYKERVISILQSAPSAVHRCDSSSDITPTLENQSRHQDVNASSSDPIMEFLRQLPSGTSADFQQYELDNICRNVHLVPREETFEKLSLYLRAIFTRPNQKLAMSEKPASTTSRRKARRIEYAKIQDLWRKSRSRCVNEILSDIDHFTYPPEEIMTTFWTTIMCKPSNDSPGIMLPERTHDELWKPITSEEIERAYLRSGAAAGPDGVSPRLLRSVPKIVLLKILNLFLLVGKVPSFLLESRTSFIAKKANASEPGDFRPIAVSSVITRCFHKILANRRSKKLPFDDRQRGFRSADGCSENVFLLDMTLRYHHQRFKSLFLSSIDIAKAFDSISHRAIVDTLISAGVPTTFVNYVKYVYETGTTRFSCPGWMSPPIRPSRGVKQGDPLSPILFNLVIDRLFKLLPNEIGADIDGMRINAAAFADDILFMSSTQRGLQTLLDMATAFFSQTGLFINSGKSFTVALKSVPHMKKAVIDTTATFTVKGHELKALKRTDQWTYLGHH